LEKILEVFEGKKRQLATILQMWFSSVSVKHKTPKQSQKETKHDFEDLKTSFKEIQL